MLEVNHINVNYGQAIALSDVSLNINEGEFVAVIGSNGSGKTTLVRTISGLLRPAQGTIKFKNERIDCLAADKILRKGISQIPEGRQLFGKLSVLDNLLLGAYTIKSGKLVGELLDFVFELFPRLFERKQQNSETLSGGEQQMLAIARALMSKPELIIFDEPSLGLMPTLVRQLFEAIEQMHNRGFTILLIEQNVQAALDLADRAYVLQTGKIVLNDICKNLLNNEMVKRAYLGM